MTREEFFEKARNELENTEIVEIQNFIFITKEEGETFREIRLEKNGTYETFALTDSKGICCTGLVTQKKYDSLYNFLESGVY